MPALLVWLFFALSVVFTLVHNFAVFASLYWYYSWFDIVMHLWGGVLVALGVHILSHFANVTLKPTLQTTLIVLLIVMVSWELFEYVAGLYNPDTYVYDTTKDLLFGLCGGLLGYSLLRYFRIGL